MTTFFVSANTTSTGLNIQPTDELYIFGHLVSAVNNGGWEYLSAGGVTSNSTVNSGGHEWIYSGGVASNSTINSGATQWIANGGLASNTILNGTQVIQGVSYATTLNSGSLETIASGAIASNTLVNSGGVEVISAGGIVRGGNVASGGIVSGLVMSNGDLFYTNGNYSIDGISIQSGATINLEVASGVAINGYIPDASLKIDAGAVANNTIINSSIAALVYGAANNSKIIAGAETIATGGVASNTTVNFQGTETILAGGVDSNTTVIGGFEIIQSGGIANATNINGGVEIISAGGTASNILVYTGGVLLVQDGGIENNAVIDGGVVEFMGKAANQTVTFGTGGNLSIANAAQFGGVISGFIQGDKINLPGLDALKLSITALNWNNNLLAVSLSDGSSFKLNLMGNYQNAVFTANHNQGTYITTNYLPAQLISLQNSTVNGYYLNSFGVAISGDMTYSDSNHLVTLSAMQSNAVGAAGGQLYTQLVNHVGGIADLTWQYNYAYLNNITNVVQSYTDSFKLTISDGQGGVLNQTIAVNVLIGGLADDTLTGSNSGFDILIGGNNRNVFKVQGGNDSLVGNIYNDTFIINAGTAHIMNFLGADILQVNGGIVSATLSAPWKAANSTYNNGIAQLYTAGYSLDLATSNGKNGFFVTDTNLGQFKAVTLTASNLGDTIYGAAGDTLLGGIGAQLFGGVNDMINAGIGAETITGAAGDSINGGKGTDTLIINGNVTITNLSGNDSLIVNNGNTINATTTPGLAWIAGNGTINNGIANVSTAFSVNLSAVNGGNGFTLTDTGVSAISLIGGNDAGDTLYGSTGATLTGGTGANIFYIKGIETITNLGHGNHDQLQVSSGATLFATLGSNGWFAASGSINNGTETLKLGSTQTQLLVNLSALTGIGKTILNDKGATNQILAGADTEIINAASNDSVTGSSGSVTFNAAVGAVFTGGTGNNLFNVNAANVTITNLGYGSSDILNVFANGSATITLGNDWIATNANTNASTVNINANQHNLNLLAITGNGVWNITDSNTSNAILTASATGVDNFTLTAANTDSLVFAKAESSAIGTKWDSINAAGTGVSIHYSSGLSGTALGVTLQAAIGKMVSFDNNDNASFGGTAPATLIAAENEIIAAYSHSSTGVVAGEFAGFSFGGKHYLLLISTSGENFVSVSDSLIQLTGMMTQLSFTQGNLLV